MERLTSAVQVVRDRDVVAIAVSILHALDTMQPCPVPAAPVPSNELAELLDKYTPGSVPQHLGAEFELYDSAMQRRYRARSENERRLGSLLWAEQCLREHDRAEHEVIRAFNRDYWGVEEPASADCSVRWGQAHQRAM